MKLTTASCRVPQQKLKDSGAIAKFVKQIEAISIPTLGRGLLRDKTPRNDFSCHCVLSMFERPSKNCVKKIRNVDVKNLPKSLFKKEGLDTACDSSFCKGGLRRIIANFWAALIFASLYQDKEVRKKSKIYEANTFKESALELSGFYSNDRRGETM